MAPVTIVIPVYNEGENIRRTLSEIDAKLAVEAELFVGEERHGVVAAVDVRLVARRKARK